MLFNTDYESRWISNILERPKGRPYNAILMFVAGVVFLSAMTRETGVWATLRFVLIVLGTGKSVPSERPTLANVLRIGRIGVIKLAAVSVDSGLVE
jgi:hypothetical protein